MTARPFSIVAARCARGPCRAAASRMGGPGRPDHCAAGFTLAELLVSVLVVTLMIFMFALLMTSATAITRTGHKHIDTDTQARVVFDRMALDFAQMLKRTDIDYYVKQRSGYKGHGNGHGWGQGKNGDLGSDQIAFFTQVPGYYPTGAQSPISLVAYRVNENTSSNAAAAYGRLERMAKGLHWAGVDDNQTNSSSRYPIVFLPQTIGAVTPWLPAVNNTNNCNGANASCDPDYEVIGPGVFRFEYYYLLKNGRVTDWPWDRWELPSQITITNPVNIGLSRVEAIAVSIAVIDPAARALIQAASVNAGYGDVLDVAADMADFRSARGRGVGGQRIGDLEAQWKGVVESIAQTGQTPSGLLIPPEAAKGIRIYNRYFDFKTL